MAWPSDYLGSDSMMRWVKEKSQGFTNVELYRISESVRAYTYLILSLQASVRSRIIVNTVSAFTAEKAFLNSFENVVTYRVDIRETSNAIKTLSVTHQARSITAWKKTCTCYPVT